MSTVRSHRRLLVALLVSALLVAGVASYYASSHPDGLEYVAEQTGFIDTADDDGPGIDSPFADYGTKGVDDERLSGGLAGVAGVALTLALGGGLFLLLRRRESPADAEAAHEPVRD